MAETGKVSISSQSNPPEVQRLVSGSLDSAPRSRRASSMSGQHANVGNDLKIDFQVQGQQLITKQKKTKWFEWSRRKDRIVDIAHMLEANDALTKKEKDFLIELGNRDYAKFCQLGRMLTVPMIGGEDYHGVTYVEDRNKVRMQTMKAVLYEAMKTYDPDGSFQQKKDTIDAALEAGKKARWMLTRTTGGPLGPMGTSLKMHKHITKETLLDPTIIYKKYNRKLANHHLYRVAVRGTLRPNEIHPAVSRRDQRRASRAVQLLINNDLLTPDAARKLMKDLSKNSNLITTLMSDISPRLEPKADREKVRALTLLALAYNNDRSELMRKTAGLQTIVQRDGREVGSNGIVLGVQPPRQILRFRWLPNLPASGSGALQTARNQWVNWAKPAPTDESDYLAGSDDYKTDNEGDDKTLPSDSVDLRSVASKQNNLNTHGIKTIEPKETRDINIIEDKETPGGLPFAPETYEYKKDVEEDGSSSDDGDGDDFINELIMEDPPKAKDETSKITQQEPAPEPHENKTDIPQSNQANQSGQFTLLEQDTNEDNRERAKSIGSTATNVSSTASQSGDQTTHIRNQNTIIHNTADDDADNDDDLADPKDVEDLYTSDSDDDDEPLDETKVTTEQEIKLAGDNADGGNGGYSLKPLRKKRIVLTDDEPLNAEDNDNNTDSDSGRDTDPSIHSLSIGDLIDETGQGKSPRKKVSPNKANEPIHSLPLMLELNDKSEDDKKLVNSMKALGEQRWPESPLGPNPLVVMRNEFTHASQELTDNLPVLDEAIKIVLEVYNAIKDDKKSLPVQPGITKQIGDAYNNATTAKGELEQLKDMLDTSALLKKRTTAEERQEFKDKITPVIGNLDVIIQHCDLVLERIKIAAKAQSESPNNNNNNNVQ